jgi:hypothetical protein
MKFPNPQEYKKINGIMYHRSEWFFKKSTAFEYMKERLAQGLHWNKKTLVKLETERMTSGTPIIYVVYVRVMDKGKVK